MKRELIFEKFENVLPSELINYSGPEEWGNGLIQLCNPREYSEYLSEGYGEKNVVAFAKTAFGDLIVWERGKYVNLISFSGHNVTVLESGFDFVFDDFEDEGFLIKYFDYDLYMDIRNNLGELKADECYTFIPLPAIAGMKMPENAQKGKLKEYLGICIELLGRIK